MLLSRAGKYVRPLVCKISRRPMSWRRNLPVLFENKSPWLDTWREARDIDRQFENMWRDVNRMLGPRLFDEYFDRTRDLEVGSDLSKLKYDSSGFELQLDVQQFTPSELNLKLAGNKLSISGKHEQKTDKYGQITREFHRELLIPEDIDLESMTSTITENGMLTIKANVKASEKPAEKVIEIQKEQVEAPNEEKKAD